MSSETMNLIESCRHYERYHRNTPKPPMTFAAYNKAFGTSLPSDKAEVENRYLKSIRRARNQEGIPVRRRMRSLHSMLTGEVAEKPRAMEPTLVQSKDGMVGIYAGGPAVRRAWTNEMCAYTPESFAKAHDESLKDAYMQAVLDQENPKLISKSNMVMYVMPKQETPAPEFEKLTVKLSSSTKPILKDQTRQGKLKTVAKTKLAVKDLNESDVTQMLKDIRSKKSGPFCVRLDV